MSILELIARLLMAAAFSAAVGFERETAQKAAGLRTHTLVGVGAATFTVVSIVGFDAGDESRVAAQVVTGIGFLGAGAIFREGATVSGLTTAAGLWAVAAIGLAAGSGSYALALIATSVVLGVLYILRAVDKAVGRRTARARSTLRIHMQTASVLSPLVKFIRKLDADAVQVDFKRLDGEACLVIVAVDPDDVSMISEMIAVHKGVDRVETLNALYRPPGETPPKSKKR